MKKLSAILGAMFFATVPLSASAAGVVATHIAEYQWKITWEDYDYVNTGLCIYNQEPYMAYMTDLEGNDRVTLYYERQVIFPSTGNYITVNLESIKPADGSYILVIPEEYVQLVPGSIYNETEYFRIEVGEDLDVSYLPVFSEVNGNAFNISWENVTELQPGITEGAYMVNVATDERYEMLYLVDDLYSKANLRVEGEFLKVNLTNNYPNLPGGTYRLYIPADYVKFNGSDIGNEAIDGFEFTYEAPWLEGPVVVEGPNDENILTLTWTNATALEYNNEYAGDGYGVLGVSIYDGKDILVDVPYPSNISFEGNVMTIDLNGLHITSGNCQLIVPEDCIYVTVNGIKDLTFGVFYRFVYENGSTPDDPDDPENPGYPEFEGNISWKIPNLGKIYTNSEPIEVSFEGFEIYINEEAEDGIGVHTPVTGYFELIWGEEAVISEDKKTLYLYLNELFRKPTD